MEVKHGGGGELHAEAAEGGLKELVLRWFTGTQAPLLQVSGSFPDWFQGFTARREAEELLRDKALGCFLIRLSDKAIGYILSYKGLDRCRHFVITQNPDGLFAISGDCLKHRSLAELIEHYRLSPIQPFGEYLTYSCCEVNSGELYDVVNVSPKGKSGVSVQALRTLWDQKSHQAGDLGKNQNQNQKQQQQQQQHGAPPTAPPTLPPKSKTRKLTGTVSVDATSLSQDIPQVPKRGPPLGFSLSGSLTETSSDASRGETPWAGTAPSPPSDRNSASSTDVSSPAPPGATYSQLMRVESRSQSLPRLDKQSLEAEEEEYSNQLGAPALSASFSAAALKRVTCHTYSLHQPRGGEEGTRSNPLYQSSEEPAAGVVQRGDAMYAEVPLSSDDTYEQIPGEAAAHSAAAAAAGQGNTYESLEDVKANKSKSTWGKNNVKWKKFLPDYKKK